MKLETNEIQAINAYLSANWEEFIEESEGILTEDECDKLAEKLATFE